MTMILQEIRPDESWIGGDGALGNAAALVPEDMPESALTLLRGSPATTPQWAVRPDVAWVVEQGLDAAAALRGMFPDQRFVPHVQASRAAVRFGLGERYAGEGFRVYVPDTAALRGYQVDDGDMPLTDWLHKADSLGFDTVWLTGSDIAAEGKGLDLELLDRGRRHFTGNLILSGGGVELRHLESLRAEGGCFGVIVPTTLLALHGADTLCSVLNPPVEPDGTDGVAA
ncbi:HisA/HisF-related TIM barrel protein [Magnetospirillum sp. 64-120]|uniref:HisA/HisF-related TIM barrel protein n=1 Tax=Magnetospirillum sp. 64-120 TaxID=1895778 RepID=UPI0025C5F152|nr:HisA/HisF-related TIM barrel protein [Magnetospirillum sp. 64-120]